MRLRLWAALRLLLLLPSTLGAREASAAELRFHPERPRLGDLVFVFVDGAEDWTETGTITAFEHRFSLLPTQPGRWRGALAVPVDIEPGSTPVIVEFAGERRNTTLFVEGRRFRTSELRVGKKFTDKEQPKALRDRIRRERRAWERMLEAAPSRARPLLPAVRPAAGLRTSEFGVQRVLNGVVQSQHYGLDLDGRIGDPVVALQSGTVKMVADRFYSGGTVVLDHGHGLYSAYFHLSKKKLRVGERVEAGATLGEVGKSGRVTGPHLHLALFVQARAVSDGQPRGLYVDPEPWVEGVWLPEVRP